MEALSILVNDPLASVLFLGAGLAFLFLEFFVPSGGVLGVLAAGCALFGVYGLFHQGRPMLGIGAFVVTGAASFFLVRFGLRRLSFSGTLPVENPGLPAEKAEGLVGKRGVTQTPLRPAGAAMIDGKKIDVVSAGGFIAENVPVRVVEI